MAAWLKNSSMHCNTKSTKSDPYDVVFPPRPVAENERSELRRGEVLRGFRQGLRSFEL